MSTRPTIVALLLLACSSPATAQEASAGLSPAAVTVGDVFHAVVIARVPLDGRVTFPDSLELPADVERAGARWLGVDTLPDRTLELRAVYPLVAWRPGAHVIPDARITATVDGASRTAELSLGALTVRSVLPADTAGIEPRPAKDVLGPSRVWWFWPLMVLLALLVGAGLVMLYRRLRRGAAQVEAFAIDPREAALAALDAALKDGLLERGDMKRFYITVSETLRHYLASTEPGLGPDLTTTELSARANHGGTLAPALSVLRSADLVKFARSRPAAEQATADWRRAREWVESFPPPPPPSLPGAEAES